MMSQGIQQHSVSVKAIGCNQTRDRPMLSLNQLIRPLGFRSGQEVLSCTENSTSLDHSCKSLQAEADMRHWKCLAAGSYTSLATRFSWSSMQTCGPQALGSNSGPLLQPVELRRAEHLMDPHPTLCLWIRPRLQLSQ